MKNCKISQIVKFFFKKSNVSLKKFFVLQKTLKVGEACLIPIPEQNSTNLKVGIIDFLSTGN